jgi:glycerol uptake facilitator-like aquaporin
VTDAKPIVAEAIATALLLAAVVGSGVMGELLAGGNTAIALLGNTLSTCAVLVVLILVFGPVSGAHMNPAVSLAFFLRKEIPFATLLAYTGAQLVGAVSGVALAHAMFELPLVQVSQHARFGPGQWTSEAVATFGLVFTVFAVLRSRPGAVCYAVGLYIAGAYWFTASTSFANPAVTVARSLTDTFSGVRPIDVPGFVAAQICGAVAALVLDRWLFPASRSTTGGDLRLDRGAR